MDNISELSDNFCMAQLSGDNSQARAASLAPLGLLLAQDVANSQTT